MIKNRNLFRITRFVLFNISKLFKLLAKFRKGQKRVLIIKTDAIGDYVLFRNYIEILRRNEKYKTYRIDLLGNPLWAEVALKYDSSFIENFYFTAPDELYESPLQLLKLGWQLFKNNYEIVLQPAYRRRFITDGLAALSAAKEIIGFDNYPEDMPVNYKIKADKFYTRLLMLPSSVSFEFYRTRFFFESVLNCNINIHTPALGFRTTEKKRIIIFPGAGIEKRRWEPEKFLALIKLILQHASEPIYLAGSHAEIPIGEYLLKNLPPRSVNNLIGKTSLPQLIELIGNATLVVSNETSAVHIAAATNTKVVAIFGGGHFNRFAPYPDDIADGPLCVFDQMECYGCNWNCKYQLPENGPFPCISAVTIEQVWNTVLQHLPIAKTCAVS